LVGLAAWQAVKDPMSKINRKMVILRIKFSTLDLGYKQRRDYTREKENFTNISQDLQKCGVSYWLLSPFFRGTLRAGFALS
jgi:hypothetical protein